jgi:hypothetical protein
MKVLLTILSLAAAFITVTASADEDRIGETNFPNGKRQDAFQVDGRNINAVKLCVRQDELQVQRFEVQFGDGSRQEIQVRPMIREGDCTEWKNLNGGRRNVVRVNLWAQSGRDPRDSRVIIMGSTNGGGGGGGGGNGGGDVLGNLRLRGGDDQVEAQVDGRNIEHVRICARRNDVRLNFVKVKFGNDEKQEVFNGGHLRQGECTRWKGLEGGRRNIKKIMARGSSFGNESVISVLGR